VKKEDDRPFFLRGPVHGQIHLVFVLNALNRHRPVEEAGFRLFCVERLSGQKRGEYKREKQSSAMMHAAPPGDQSSTDFL